MRENLGGYDEQSICMILITILWFILWIVTLLNAINLVKSKKVKDRKTPLVIAALMWPFYWVFHVTGAY